MSPSPSKQPTALSPDSSVVSGPSGIVPEASENPCDFDSLHGSIVAEDSGSFASSPANLQSDDGTDPVGDTPITAEVAASPLIKRTERKQHRKDQLKGLPSREVIRSLAKVYLTEQRVLWPDLANTPLLPSPEDETAIDRMADVFEQRYRSGKLPERPSLHPAAEIANSLGYLRVSDDGSNAMSLPDQFHGVLHKAAALREWIPWEWVLADHAVTGLNASRRDYVMVKALVESKTFKVRTVFIDDFSRAGRNALEWWFFAAALMKNRKNLIGAADGFDLNSQMGQIMMSVFVMVSTLFIKQLQEKVRRGMRGAARRGTSTGRPAIGYMLIQDQTAGGTLAFGTDGQPLMRLTIDPTLAPWVEVAFVLYGEQNWTLGKIAKHFSANVVGGKSWWRASDIRQLLRRVNYVGVLLYAMHSCEYDPVEGTVTRKPNPRGVRITKRCRSLRIVSNQLFMKVRRRMEASAAMHAARTPANRPAQMAATLMAGGMVCEDCDRLEAANAFIGLARSGQYSSYCCPRGFQSIGKCTLKCSKSVSIVESTLLGWLYDCLNAPTVKEQLVQKSNAALGEAQRSLEGDPKPLEKKLASLERAIGNLSAWCEETDPKDAMEGPHLRKKLAEREKEYAEVAAQLKAMREKHAVAHISPVTFGEVESYLQNLYETLRGPLEGKPARDDFPRLSKALQDIFGPILIRQEKKTGRGAVWIATFTPSWKSLLPPTAYSATIETKPVTLRIDKLPKAVQFADDVLRPLLDAQPPGKRLSQNLLANITKAPYQLVGQAMAYLRTGKFTPKKEPPRKQKREKAASPPKEPLYKILGTEIVRLVDVEHMSWSRIAEKLGISISTACRAYYAQKPELLAKAAKTGKRTHRTSARKLSQAQEEQVKKMKKLGISVSMIARELNCSPQTIDRTLRRQQATS